MTTTYLIVVGVDGSAGGWRALQWAAHEAATRGGAVQAVIAWSWDGLEYGPIAATRPQEEADRAARLLDSEINELIAQRGSSLPVAGEVVEGRPADVLCAAGRKADLLVLGSHGHSRVRHTVLGSVSEECIRKAACPVVVIPVPVERQEPASEPVLSLDASRTRCLAESPARQYPVAGRRLPRPETSGRGSCTGSADHGAGAPAHPAADATQP